MARKAFITGASSGIGRALSRELAGRGYDLVLTARRREVLDEVRGEIVAAHPERRVEIRALDVNDSEDVERALAESAELLGGLDLVVANAGVGNSGRVGEGNIARARMIIETNLLGAIATVDAAVALFRRRGGGGQIVGIASVAGVRGVPGSSTYGASKAGLIAYLQSVAAETHAEPITVTTILPGYIDTPLNQDVPRRPFLIGVDDGARKIADLIERGVGYATVPRFPWAVLAPLLRVLPTSLIARSVSQRPAPPR